MKVIESLVGPNLALYHQIAQIRRNLLYHSMEQYFNRLNMTVLTDPICQLASVWQYVKVNVSCDFIKMEKS